MKTPSIPLRICGGVDPVFDRDKIHEAGAKRHGAAWVQANERAATAAGKYMDVSDLTVREFLPLVILRILDGNKFDLGLRWNKEKETWEKKA